MDFKEFSIILKGAFPEVTDGQLRAFEKLEPLYAEWNEKINVISRKDIEGIYEHHILHSLCIAAYLKEKGLLNSFANASVLDLGTGGGFPGVPLAILFPQADFTLCDSVGKKVIVAGGVAKELDLANVSVVNARAETLGRAFDYVVSRAVTSLDNFYPWVKGKYNKGILYLKGGELEEEIQSLCRKNHLSKALIHKWEVNSWLGREYFNEKFVIHIEKI